VSCWRDTEKSRQESATTWAIAQGGVARGCTGMTFSLSWRLNPGTMGGIAQTQYRRSQEKVFGIGGSSVQEFIPIFPNAPDFWNRRSSNRNSRNKNRNSRNRDRNRGIPFPHNSIVRAEVLGFDGARGRHPVTAQRSASAADEHHAFAARCVGGCSSRAKTCMVEVHTANRFKSRKKPRHALALKFRPISWMIGL
jgi:hypothetical protein